MIDDHGYDSNHINGIIDLTDKGIGVKQSFLKWALRAQWIDYNIDLKKSSSNNLGKCVILMKYRP